LVFLWLISDSARKNLNREIIENKRDRKLAKINISGYFCRQEHINPRKRKDYSMEEILMGGTGMFLLPHSIP
jgi:hypothetical protein